MIHLTMLSDESLECLADLHQCIDMHGILPSQCWNTSIPMLPKPNGGNRLIGLFSFLYRSWAGSRRSYSKEWEPKFDEPFFAAAKGRMATDVVWRTMVEAEAAA